MIWPTRAKIGLDIGNRTLKALKLRKSGDRVFLEKYFFYDLSEGNAKFPIVPALDETLKALVEVAGFKNHAVAGCIDDSEVATFDLQLPQMPPADLSEAVISLIEGKINFPIEESCIDHVILGETKKNGETTLDVRAYSARLDDVKAIAGILESASLNFESLDVTMLANVGMLHFNGYLEEDQNCVILDLGETKTSVALTRGTKLLACNAISIAIGAINLRLKDALHISYQDAEKLKTKLSQKHEEGESHAQNIVDGVYLELIRELQRSLEFFRSSVQGQPVNKILAIGGGAQFQSVLATIQATCGAEVTVANPFRNIEIFDKKGKNNGEKIAQFAPHMATVVGLALRGLNVA